MVYHSLGPVPQWRGSGSTAESVEEQLNKKNQCILVSHSPGFVHSGADKKKKVSSQRSQMDIGGLNHGSEHSRISRNTSESVDVE